MAEELSMAGARKHLPADLGRVEDIDSFSVEAGVIVLERFCALSAVHRTDHGWWVRVTDVRREMGAAPHHRLRLQLVRVDDEADRKLRRAIHKNTSVHPRTHAIYTSREGLLLLTEPCTAPQVQQPLTRDESLVVASALAAAVDQLHATNVTGVAFEPEYLHLVGRDLTAVSFEHLLARGTAEEDVRRLVGMMELLSGGAIADLLDPCPLTAAEVWDRAQRAQRAHEEATRQVTLPGTPPFVGRSELLVRLMEAARHTKTGQSSIVVIQAEEGVGKSRLLQRFAVEVERWMDAVVLAGTFKSGAPPLHGGFVEALNALAESPGHLDAAELGEIRSRIVERTGTLVGVISRLTPALTRFLGNEEAPTQDNIDERFNRHAATFAKAISAIGTPERPLIILLDDVHRADRAALAIMCELVHSARDHNTLVVVTSTEPLDQSTHDSVFEMGLLNRAELRLLLESSVPGTLDNVDEAVEALWRASQGHLVDAWATLQSWASRSRFVTTSNGLLLDLQELETSGSVVDLYGEQWRGLSPHQQWVLLVAALRSGRASTAWLSRVTGWNQAEVDNALLPSIEAGLLVREPDGIVRFPNNAVRALVTNTVTDEVKLGAHRQIANWLEREPGASAAQVAWHQEHARASGRDERLAQRHVQGGQELLNLYDLDRASWHFQRALSRAETAQTKTAALEGKADAALLDGRTDLALDNYLTAMDAGTDVLYALRISTKAMQGFYRKSAPEATYELSSESLRRVGEPIPSTVMGWLWAFLVAFVALTLTTSKQTTAVRDQLCRLYVYLMATVGIERPMLSLLAMLRGTHHARGLDTENAAAMISLYGLIRGSMGHVRAAESLLDEAEAVASRARRPWGIGVVSHFRGQWQYSIGLYADAEDSIQEAVREFRRAGDMSVAVLSLVYRAVYGKDMHHLHKVLAWVRDTEDIARRQGNEIGLRGAATLRCYLLARRGEDVTQALLAHSTAILGTEVGGNESINAHAYLAMGFAEVGDLVRAERHIQEAHSLIQAMPSAVDVFLDAYVAIAAVQARISRRNRRQDRMLKQALKMLRSRSRGSRRLLAPYLYYCARVQVGQGNKAKATELFERVISEAGTHEQTFYVQRAHLALAELCHASQPAIAAQHREDARQLGLELGLVDAKVDRKEPMPRVVPGAPVRPAAAMVRLPPALAPSDVGVASLIRRLRPAFERALPSRVPLSIEVADDARASCNPETLQLLIVNMVLAARDALADDGEIRLSVSNVRLDQEDAARMPGINADAHLRIEVRAIGFNGSETISGLGMCCEITAGMGGFVDVRQDVGNVLVLAAYLAPGSTAARPSTPAPAPPRAQAVVYHATSRTRQTVVSALRDLGVLAEGIEPGLHVYGDTVEAGRIVFADADAYDGLRRANPDAVMVLVQGRNQPIETDQATLRVPFTLGEFEQLLDSLLSPDPSEAESRRH